MKYSLSSLDHIDPKIIDFTMFHTRDMYDICMANFYDDETLSEAVDTETVDVHIYFLDNALFEVVRNPSQIPFGIGVLTEATYTVFVCLDKGSEEYKSNEFFKNDLKLDFHTLGDLSDDELVAVYTAKWLSDGLINYMLNNVV